MRLNGPRGGHARRTDRPSEMASGRLRDELRRDVAELRVRLEELALRSEVHQVTGNEDGIEAAIVEQRQMLRQFERRVRHRIADAIVEREAEVVLSGALVELHRAGADTGAFGPREFPQPSSRFARSSRAVAAAAAAALATMFMFSSGTTGIDPASAPSVGTEAIASTAEVDRVGSATTTRDVAGRDELVVAGEKTTDASSLRQRIQRRIQAGSDAPRDDAQFLEQLLTRLFGAVASVTTSTFTQPTDMLDPTDLSTGGLEAQVDEIVEDAFEVPSTTDDDGQAEADADASAPATDDASASDEPDSGADLTDEGTPDRDDDPDGAEPDADASDDSTFGGFSSGTQSGSSTGSGTGLLNWG